MFTPGSKTEGRVPTTSWNKVTIFGGPIASICRLWFCRIKKRELSQAPLILPVDGFYEGIARKDCHKGTASSLLQLR